MSAVEPLHGVVADDAPRLDKATLTATVYPTCGEATITLQGRSRGKEDRLCDLLRSLAIDVAERTSTRGAAVDAERSMRVSMGRTRRQVRRWCVHHGATRLVTLTYAPEHLPESLDAGWGDARNLRRRLDALNVPQPLLVPEWGETNGRFHFHAGLTRYTKKSTLENAWPHGFVEVRRLETLRKASTDRERSRIVGGYVGGYIAKNARTEGERGGAAHPPAGSVGFNRRRYSIPKGTTVPSVRITGDSIYDLQMQAQSLCGHVLTEAWNSGQTDDWQGPPTLLLMG